MDRVSATGFQTIGGKRYYQDVNEEAGIQGTDWAQIWANGVQESIVGTTEASGQTPADSATGSPDTQLLDAILAFAGANVQAVNSTPGSALVALSAGLVVVNATSGNISMTLPASAGLGGQVQRWKFVRTDATSNTVSISFHAGDTFLIGGGGGPVALGPQSVLDLVADGSTHWVQTNASTFTGIFIDTGTANAMVVTLSPVPSSLSSIAGIPFLVVKSASASTGALTLAVNGLTATVVELADQTAFSASIVWPAGAVALVVYDGTEFRALTEPDSGSLIRLSNFSGGNVSIGSTWTAQKLPSGLIRQTVRGSGMAVGTDGATQTITFPWTFPNGISTYGVSIMLTGSSNDESDDCWFQVLGAPTTSQITILYQQASNVAGGGTVYPTVWAEGN